MLGGSKRGVKHMYSTFQFLFLHSFSLTFLPESLMSEELLLAIYLTPVFWQQIFLVFLHQRRSLFHLIPEDIFFFHFLLLPWFLMRNLQPLMLVLPCGYSIGFSWLLSRILFVCLFLAFSSLMCLDVDFIEFILLGIYWNSWIFKFISFTKLGSFQPIFLLILFQHHSLFPPGTLTTWMSDTLLFTHLPLRFSLFPSWFFSLCCLAWRISFDLSSSSQTPLFIISILLLTLPSDFVLYFGDWIFQF